MDHRTVHLLTAVTCGDALVSLLDRGQTHHLKRIGARSNAVTNASE
jgi:hypothetical protein